MPMFIEIGWKNSKIKKLCDKNFKYLDIKENSDNISFLAFSFLPIEPFPGTYGLFPYGTPCKANTRNKKNLVVVLHLDTS